MEKIKEKIEEKFNEIFKGKITGKQIIIIGAIILILAALITAIVVIINVGKKEEYRIIKVYETEGRNIVTRINIGEIDAYENMVLENGDNVSVGTGRLTLKLDDDKYLYAEANTQFELLASGNSMNSKTTINLIDGSIANELQKKLNDDSYYEINTPNSTMSVRGTIYYVSTYIGEDGIRYTKVTVFDGTVETDLILPDGSKGNSNKLVEKGKEIIIYTDDKAEGGSITDYANDIRDINYDELPASLLDTIRNMKDKEGNTLLIPENVLDEIDLGKEEGPYTVTFMYGNDVFATQQVNWGEKAKKPKLQPEQTGEWDFDFNSLVKEDISINWK